MKKKKNTTKFYIISLSREILRLKLFGKRNRIKISDEFVNSILDFLKNGVVLERSDFFRIETGKIIFPRNKIFKFSKVEDKTLDSFCFLDESQEVDSLSCIYSAFCQKIFIIKKGQEVAVTILIKEN